MKIKIRRLAITLGTLCLACIACVGITTVGIAVWCEILKQPPEAPKYPGAMLVSETSHLIVYSTAERYYISSDSPDKITSFYQEKMFHQGYQPGTPCPDRNLAGECFGNATPFGKYYVYVRDDSFVSTNTTKFIIEFRWEACGLVF